jgi:hypothetical protein
MKNFMTSRNGLRQGVLVFRKRRPIKRRRMKGKMSKRKMKAGFNNQILSKTGKNCNTLKVLQKYFIIGIFPTTLR